MPLADSLAAPVRLYVMGENVWRSEPEWPLARTRYTPFYLRSAGRANSGAGDGRLTRDAPGAAEPADAYVYDPRDPVPSRGGAMLSARAGIALQTDIEKRADVLVYTRRARFPLRRWRPCQHQRQGFFSTSTVLMGALCCAPRLYAGEDFVSRATCFSAASIRMCSSR